MENKLLLIMGHPKIVDMSIKSDPNSVEGAEILPESKAPKIATGMVTRR